jgi:hypothetical protein
MDIWGCADNGCDMEAKEFQKLEDAKGTTVKSMKLHDEPWSVWISKEKISTQVRATLYNHIHDPQAVHKW